MRVSLNPLENLSARDRNRVTENGGTAVLSSTYDSSKTWEICSQVILTVHHQERIQGEFRSALDASHNDARVERTVSHSLICGQSCVRAAGPTTAATCPPLTVTVIVSRPLTAS